MPCSSRPSWPRYVGVRHCRADATPPPPALWLALRALGVKAGDEILVPSHTAFPTIEAICFAEATPVFVDADDYYTMDPADAAAKATPRTVGLVPVHLYGQPVDLDAIRELAPAPRALDARGLRAGPRGGLGRPEGRRLRPGGASSPSIRRRTSPVMGDGGAVVTDDDEIAARCRRLRDHGRLNKDLHAEVGFNLRFNEIQAAIGRVLLRRLDAMNDRRRALAARYARGAGRAAARACPRERRRARHVYHLYVVRTPRRGRAGGVPQGARHPDRHPLPGADATGSRPSSASPGRRCPRRSGSWTRS